MKRIRLNNRSEIKVESRELSVQSIECGVGIESFSLFSTLHSRLSTLFLLLVPLFVLSGAESLFAATDPFTLPNMSLEVGGDDPEGLSVAIQIIMFLALLTFLPAILIMMTSFTRL